MNNRIFMTAVLTIGICSFAAAEVVVKNNDKIAFLGDSITYMGNSSTGGYVNLVMAGLLANNIKAEKIPAGIGGHKSNQMLARLEKDVLEHKPQIMTLSCGVNDVWHGERGVKLEDYKKNIRAIVEKAQAAGIKVCILTATMIKEDANNDFNRQLADYNKFLRELAAEKQCLLADLNADMQKAIADFKKAHPKAVGNYLTNDGVHMNSGGNAMMARGVLRALGFDAEQLKKAEQSWLNKTCSIGMLQIDAADLEKIAVKAAAKGVSIKDYIYDLVVQDANGR